MKRKPATSMPPVPAPAPAVPSSPSAPDSGPRLLTLAEVATRTTLSLASVRSLVATGALPVVRISARRLAILETDLERFIASRRETGK